MSVLEYTSGGYHYEMTMDFVADTIQAPINVFIRLLDDLRERATLSSFEAIRQQDGQTYTYEFTTVDNRTFSQTIKIPPAGKASMTFDVPDYWTLDEFISHRPLRDQFIEICRQYGVAVIEATWS